MSINLMSAVFSASDLTSTEKLILLAMADFANDDGLSIYPSIETLSKKTALAERTVQRTIQGLCDRGIVGLQVQGNGRYHTNEYRIYKGKMTIEKGDTETRKGDRQYIKGDPTSTKGDRETGKGDTRSPDPSLTIIESPKESSVEAGNKNQPTRAARIVSAAVAGLFIPSTEYARIEQLEQMIDFYGWDKCLDALKFESERWTKTKRASGGYYKITNMGWVDWANEKLMRESKSEERKPKTQKVIFPGGFIDEVKA